MEREVIRCIKCGACQTVCPVFRELGTESAVARGKIRLIKAAISGDVESRSARFGELLSRCLLCGACQENCPSGVNFHDLLTRARVQLAEEKGLPLLTRLVLRLGLRNRRVFEAALGFGSLGQWLMFRRASSGEGMLPRLPMGLDMRRLVAPVSSQSFRSRHPEAINVTNPKRKVAFFTGCMINHLYPETGESVLKLLSRNQVSVVLPASQHCCGAPAFSNGDEATAIEMAKSAVSTFAALDVDAVVTACGSCGAMFRKQFPELLRNLPKYFEKSQMLARKTIDFTELLVDIGLSGELTKVKRNVTYHDSCHLVRIQGVRSQPRRLIGSIPGVTLSEMEQPGRCCGGAGSFSLHHYDLSCKIVHQKLDDIVATEADTVVAGCPMCVMHIRDGVHQNGLPTKVMHTADLLAEAYDD